MGRSPAAPESSRAKEVLIWILTVSKGSLACCAGFAIRGAVAKAARRILPSGNVDRRVRREARGSESPHFLCAEDR